MLSLDFITHPQFRGSLEADYADLLRCFETRAWKSVSVLAGSIVEALLVDYLVATHDTRGGRDPLKMDLADTISVCKAEGVLSERTADLCSVVRSYRNLIHPGRAIRLGEAPPNEASAKIALALVELIVDDVAGKRKAAFGLTGEQILSKLERDPNSIPILQHLLAEASAREKQRLLLDLVPSRFLTLEAQEDQSVDAALLHRLSQAFRVILDSVDAKAKIEVANRFVDIVKSADGHTVMSYAAAFFRAPDIENVTEAHRPLVVQFLLATMNPALEASRLEMIEGIEEFLGESDMPRWLDPIVKTLTSSATTPTTKDAVRQYYNQTLWGTSRQLDRAVLKRLTMWHASFQARNAQSALETIQQLREGVPPSFDEAESDEDDDLPF